jgi:hypothetical protein
MVLIPNFKRDFFFASLEARSGLIIHSPSCRGVGRASNAALPSPRTPPPLTALAILLPSPPACAEKRNLTPSSRLLPIASSASGRIHPSISHAQGYDYLLYTVAESAFSTTICPGEARAKAWIYSNDRVASVECPSAARSPPPNLRSQWPHRSPTHGR